MNITQLVQRVVCNGKPIKAVKYGNMTPNNRGSKKEYDLYYVTMAKRLNISKKEAIEKEYEILRKKYKF